MTKYVLEHNRPDCIGCAACVAVNPKHWVMNEDNKADIIGAPRRPDGWEEIEIEQDDFEADKAAAESCPVNVIHLKNKDSGEKIL